MLPILASKYPFKGFFASIFSLIRLPFVLLRRSLVIWTSITGFGRRRSLAASGMPTKYPILVGSYTNEIFTLEFDAEAGTLKLKGSTTVGHHPSWLEGHPSDPSIIFTGLEQSDGKLLAVKYTPDTPQGTVISETASLGADPCSLLVSPEHVFTANVRPPLPAPSSPLPLI